MAEVQLTLCLRYPYKVSLMELEHLTSIWTIRVLKASTRHRIAHIAMPSETYKRIFMEAPSTGEIPVPVLLQTFLEKIVIDGTSGNVKEYQKTKRKTLDRKRR